MLGNSHCALLSFAVCVVLATGANALCHTPDGGISSDLPCNAGAGNSTCCKLGFSCTNNNFCLDKANVGQDGLSVNGIYVRGTCTDSSFKDEACAQHCTTSAPDGGETVVYCGNGMYCCDADAPNCCTSGIAQKFDLGEPSVTAVVGGSPPPNARPSSSSATSPTGSGPSSQSATSTSSSLSSNGNPQEQQAGKSDGNDKIVAVGVGVGVPLGILLLGSIAFAVWWFKRIEGRMQQRDDIMREEVRSEVIKAVELSSMTSVYEMGSEGGVTRVERYASKSHVEMP